LEGALKLKEISYLHAEGYPAGELKHGPIALVDRKTTVVLLAPLDKSNDKSNDYSNGKSLQEKLMSNLQEVKLRGATIFTVGTEGDNKFLKESNYFVGVPSSSWALSPMLMSIPLQLFAYSKALLKGTDVDKPRNLAKSVTVE
jgi:glucosamine--fructose-6-phosphate aminotransferase (isomerizing)